MTMFQTGAGLCDKCRFRKRVVAHEVGVTLDACAIFNKPLSDLGGRITECSSFADTTLNHVHGFMAWRRDVDSRGRSVWRDDDGRTIAIYDYALADPKIDLTKQKKVGLNHNAVEAEEEEAS